MPAKADTTSPRTICLKRQTVAAMPYYPTGLAIDASNNLYIAVSNNNYVRKVSLTSGIITTVAGRGAGLATAAMEGRQTLPSIS
jgi:hypothetical protein